MLIFPLCLIFKSDLPGSAMRRLGWTEGMRGKQLVAEGGHKGCMWPVTGGLFDLLKKTVNSVYQIDACSGKRPVNGRMPAIGLGSRPVTMTPRQPLIVIILTRQTIDGLTWAYPCPGAALLTMNRRLLRRISSLVPSQHADHPPDQRHGL